MYSKPSSCLYCITKWQDSIASCKCMKHWESSTNSSIHVSNNFTDRYVFKITSSFKGQPQLIRIDLIECRNHYLQIHERDRCCMREISERIFCCGSTGVVINIVNCCHCKSLLRILGGQTTPSKANWSHTYPIAQVRSQLQNIAA